MIFCGGSIIHGITVNFNPQMDQNSQGHARGSNPNDLLSHLCISICYGND